MMKVNNVIGSAKLPVSAFNVQFIRNRHSEKFFYHKNFYYVLPKQESVIFGHSDGRYRKQVIT